MKIRDTLTFLPSLHQSSGIYDTPCITLGAWGLRGQQDREGPLPRGAYILVGKEKQEKLNKIILGGGKPYKGKKYNKVIEVDPLFGG